jgi:outer membrane protein assembly factor BamB
MIEVRRIGIVFLAALLLTGAWPSYRGNDRNSGAISTRMRLSGVRLIPQWSYRARSEITSSAASAYGLVYVGTWNGRVVAVHEQTGKVAWSASLGANPVEIYGGPRGVIGSVAIARGKVFAVSGSCVAAAFVAQTGRQLWRHSICSLARNDDTFASPVVACGAVLFGIDILADRPTDQGRLIALDAQTGRTRWTFDVVHYRGTGSGISATPAVDSKHDLVFVGTGNPTPIGSPPPGPDPFSESIVALDSCTGKLRWSFGPVHPHDKLDRDLFASPNLFSIMVHGRTREVVGEGGKDGSYYVVDALTGAPIWHRRVAPQLPYGMVMGTAALAQGLAIVPVWQGDEKGRLVALDARDGSPRWSDPMAGLYGAPLVFGSVLFVLQANGTLTAVRLSNGRTLLNRPIAKPAHSRGPSADGDRIFVTAGDGLYVLRVEGS